MKKRYIKPETAVVDVEPESMMAASGRMFGETNEISVQDDDNNMYSKGHGPDVWGFDEDED